MGRIKKGLKSKKVYGEKRWTEINGVWLIYNYDKFVDWDWTKRGAIQNANYLDNGTFSDVLPDYYQLVRGDIKIKIIKKIN